MVLMGIPEAGWRHAAIVQQLPRMAGAAGIVEKTTTLIRANGSGKLEVASQCQPTVGRNGWPRRCYSASKRRELGFGYYWGPTTPNCGKF